MPPQTATQASWAAANCWARATTAAAAADFDAASGAFGVSPAAIGRPAGPCRVSVSAPIANVVATVRNFIGESPTTSIPAIGHGERENLDRIELRLTPEPVAQLPQRLRHVD